MAETTPTEYDDDGDPIDRRPRIVPAVADQALPSGALRLAKSDGHPIFPSKPRPTGHFYADETGESRARRFERCGECNGSGVEVSEIDLDDDRYPWVGAPPPVDANVNWDALPQRWAVEACDLCSNPDYLCWVDPDGYGCGWVPVLADAEQARLDAAIAWREAGREAAHLALPDGGPECAQMRRYCCHPGANRARVAEKQAFIDQEMAARERRGQRRWCDPIHTVVMNESARRAERGERIAAGAPGSIDELKVVLAGIAARIEAGRADVARAASLLGDAEQAYRHAVEGSGHGDADEAAGLLAGAGAGTGEAAGLVAAAVAAVREVAGRL